MWTDWEAFAQYAFNKSHSTCYAFVAYQTAWLKANYPAEYMASVLTHAGGQIDKITFFMEECRRMGIPVLGPDVNESQLQFSVNKQGQIRFGLGAVKGVGEAAVQTMIDERKSERGAFTTIYDLVRRVNLRAANRKALESLAYAGAFDSLKVQRAHFFHSAGEGKPTWIETLARYGQQHQDGADSAQVNMFGDADEGAGIPEPPFPQIEGWSALEQLHYEKEVVGFYLSGHPLDDHRLEIKHLCKNTLGQLTDLKHLVGLEASFVGIVTTAEHRIAKTGKPFGSFSIEDHNGSHDFMLFSEDYMKYKLYLQQGTLLFVKGRAAERTWGRDEGQLEFRISSMDLLSDIREKYFTKLSLRMEAERVNEDMTRELAAVFKEHPGKCKVSVSLYSPAENLNVELNAKGTSVAVTEALMDRLGAMADVEVKLG